MKIIDLSMTLKNNMIYYPGDPIPEFHPALTFEKDGCRVTELKIGSHTGTHMDAPSHFIKDGKTVDEISLYNCMGRAEIIDCREIKAGEEITKNIISNNIERIKQAEIVLLYTGWTEKCTDKDIYNHPYISKETASLLVECNIKAVGVDMLNVDKTITEGEKYTENATEAHNILLGNGILIVENLVNISAINFKNPFVCFFPLNIKGADGSPVRAIAIEE